MEDDPGRIVVSGLTKAFGSVKAVDDLNFVVEPGSVTGFLGPNGAGKTTTLRMVLGLATPDSGKATIGGKAYARLAEPGKSVGAVLEATSFHPGRSALAHLQIYCLAAGFPKQRAHEVLEIVGLTAAAKRKVRGFSLGMRQRLALATALLGDPRVLILDEPANGLDPEGIAWLRTFLRKLAEEQGRSVLVSSHLLSEVEQTVDRVVILARGRMVHEGTLSELTADHSPGVLVKTPTPDALISAVTPLGGNATLTPEGFLEVSGLDVATVGHTAWESNIELHELTPQKSDLEGVFLQLTTAADAESADVPVEASPEVDSTDVARSTE